MTRAEGNQQQVITRVRVQGCESTAHGRGGGEGKDKRQGSGMDETREGLGVRLQATLCNAVPQSKANQAALSNWPSLVAPAVHSTW